MITSREVKIAKNVDDVLILVEELIVCVKNKGNYQELLDELIEAVSGADEIPEEIKDMEALVATVALRVSGLIEAFKS